MSAKIFFIDGPNYCGKTKVIATIEQKLVEDGKRVKVLREPGGDIIGEQIRNTLLSKEINDACEMDYTARRLLYHASHAQLLKNLREIVTDYDVILIDRFVLFSDLVYGAMAEEDAEVFQKKIALSKSLSGLHDNDILKSDNVSLFLLDIYKETLHERAEARGESEGKLYDYKDMNFKEQVWGHYNNLGSHTACGGMDECLMPIKSIHMIDANEDVDNTAAQIMLFL